MSLQVHSATLGDGRGFRVAATASLLTAAQEGGVALPYSCRTGRCSTCKCKVLSGSTRALQAETGLTDQEKAEGWVLSCVRTALSDLMLEVEDLGGVELPISKTLPCRIHGIQRLADDVIQVFLRLPPNAGFDYLPGQYIDVIGAKGVRRSYSIASAHRPDKMLELHIRAVEGGVMSDYWFNQAKDKDLLRLTGPHGTFFLRNAAELNVVFLATGTGIAPVKAILESLAHAGPEQHPVSVTVLWGGRKMKDIYLDVSGIYGECQFIPVLSRSDATWLGVKGHVQHALVALKPDWKNTVVYACGSDAMIHDAKTLLLAEGLPSKRFHSDAFVCSAVN